MDEQTKRYITQSETSANFVNPGLMGAIEFIHDEYNFQNSEDLKEYLGKLKSTEKTSA